MNKLYCSYALGIYALLLPKIVLACNIEPSDQLYKYIQEKNFVAAEKLARERVTLDKNSRKALSDLAIVYAKSSMKEVIVFDSTAFGLKQGESGTVKIDNIETLKKGMKPDISVDWNKAEKAEAVYLKLLSKWPKSKYDHLCLLDLYMLAGKKDKLAASLERYVKNFKKANNQGFIQELLTIPGTVISKYKDYQYASRLYEVLLRTYPKSPELLSSYGAALGNSSNSKKALELFEKAYQYNKNKQDTHRKKLR